MNRPAECRDVNLEAVLLPSAVSEGAIGSTKAAAAAADAIREEMYELARDGTMSASLDRWASLSASETRSVLSMQASGREKQMLAWALGAVVLLAGCIVWQVRRTSANQSEIIRVLESTTDSVMFLDSAWTITFMNERARLQISEGRDICGRNLWHEFPKAIGSPFWTAYHKARDEQQHVVFETYFEPLKKFYFVNVYPSPGRLAIFFRDVTLANTVDEELRNRRKQLDDISANIPGAVFQFALARDRSRSFPFMSAGVKNLYGVSAEDAMRDADMLFALVDPEDVPRVEKSIEHSVLSGSPWQCDYRVRTERGVRWLSGNAIPEQQPEGKILWNGVLMDVTAQKDAEEQIGIQRDRAEAASRAKSAFLAAMSHEIRTPLNGVIGTTELLLDTTLDLEQKDLTSTIRTSGELLLAVINDILDFSKIEADKLQLAPAPFDLDTLLESVVDIAGAAADRKNIDLELQIADDLPNRLIGDAQRMKQVILNLVGNAVKFTEKGEVVISAGLISNHAVPRVRIAVTDTGIGIPADVQSQLFQSFSQGDSSMSRRFGGTGLGLAISKRLTTLMEGTLVVDSIEGVGSTFTIELPLVRDLSTEAGPNTFATGRAAVLSESPVADQVFCRFRESGLDVSTMSLSGTDSLAEIDCCVVVLSGSHDEVTEQAKRWQNLLAGSNCRQVAVLHSRRRRTFQTLRREGWICLGQPLRPERIAASLDPVVTSETKSSGTPLLHAHVLVAEDNLVNQTVARRMLERMGCTVDIAANGAEAVSAACSRAYDAILMDCQMPEMDGFEAARLIREFQRGRSGTPIIAMTAHAVSGDREMCLSAGMDDYISKPVSIGAMSSVLSRWISAVKSGAYMSKDVSEDVAELSGQSL
ncbi:MAG: response regulator [Bryobacteraceae bacterium]|nr:response regulator [Bryobacteraceae bacterium]